MSVNVEKMMLAFGETVREALEDVAVVEILINDDGSVWLERLGGDGVQATGTYISADDLTAAVQAVAFLKATVVNSDSPLLQGELPGSGARIQAVMPPVVERGVIAIRKRASAYYDLDSYVSSDRMTADMACQIRRSIRERENILVSGGTGSGKTTLVNAIIGEIAEVEPLARLVVLEDTKELQPRSKNVAALQTSEGVTMRDLLRVTLRMRPDRILVGEVRDGAAKDMLEAWNTGHPGGGCTVHADDPRGALRRIENLAAEGTLNGRVPKASVADAVGLIVQAERGPNGPRVREVASVLGLDGEGEYALERRAVHPESKAAALQGE